VGRLLPLCLLSGEDWENDTSLYVSPKKGELCESREKPPLERCSQTLVWGKHRTRLVAGCRIKRAEARTHFKTKGGSTMEENNNPKLKDANGAWFIMGTSYRQQVGKVQFQVVSHFGGKDAIEEKLGDLMVDELSENVSEDAPEPPN
jgi:ribosome-associated toxin RatA of RatAB toxin-antitoxin module